ncbi:MULTISPECIES: TlpA disulfide reductase family protein [unclassified Nocardioides]|uniref:TlpA family protein disulfide reductase n=1 Tax=unclassified Nocardioides TaxID=2615069 RepID=UPI0000570553|nr:MULTISPECIES: TlpA disulfide reductase family protein [unclassified Nocardioides]ABL79885.1 Redoxin domain protein [Nocardioides sp. JS614]
MRRLLPAVLAAAVLVLGACGSADLPKPPGQAKVDVDTPELRAIRADAGIEPCRQAAGAAVDGGLPDVTLPCLGGGPDVDLAGLRGPVVVNLWASWCGPCRKELPIYQQFHERYGDRVGVVGIDYNDVQPKAALELARDTGVTYPLLADPGSTLEGTESFPTIPGLPWVVLVDADGKVVHKQAIEITSVDQLVGLVDEHLGTDL